LCGICPAGLEERTAGELARLFLPFLMKARLLQRAVKTPFFSGYLLA